jgi:hypothetical protein
MLKKTINGNKNNHFCLSCGTTENISNRRYCSVKCRQNLRQKLNLKSGLMQALNVRYAAFYFSDIMIMLDIVPHGVKEIFRYSGKRKEGNNPAADFHIMTNKLGEAWWAESKRTNKNYMATQHVLKLATRHAISDGLQRPKLARIPAVKLEYLNYLKINKTDLHSREINKIIKDAYRKQVKIHHPDLGGHAETFRKIHNAYKEILRWADNPICIHRRGFPDKWYYNEESRKWVQPTPLRE